MPIDPKLARNATFEKTHASWEQDDVILYHLGIGAGAGKATDPKELEYTYERNLKVLPSFAVIPVFGALGHLGSIPGVSVNFALVLHGEQDVEIHRPIPTSAKIETTGRVAGLYDKGKAALIVLEVASRLEGGEPLFTNRFSILARCRGRARAGAREGGRRPRWGRGGGGGGGGGSRFSPTASPSSRAARVAS